MFTARGSVNLKHLKHCNPIPGGLCPGWKEPSEFGLNEPEDVLKKVRASKHSATIASMRAPPRVVDGGGTLLAHKMA